MKALILSCNTGQGHNTAARAILEELTARGIECEMHDALAFASRFVSDTVCSIYNKASLRIPHVLGVGIKGAKLTDKPILRLGEGGKAINENYRI